jgi:alpha-tubulin suppressor-like RCC1 family protein
MQLPDDAIARAVPLGLNLNLALTNDGHVVAWGNNIRGQLGTGQIANQP